MLELCRKSCFDEWGTKELFDLLRFLTIFPLELSANILLHFRIKQAVKASRPALHVSGSQKISSLTTVLLQQERKLA